MSAGHLKLLLLSLPLTTLPCKVTLLSRDLLVQVYSNICSTHIYTLYKDSLSLHIAGLLLAFYLGTQQMTNLLRSFLIKLVC